MDKITISLEVPVNETVARDFFKLLAQLSHDYADRPVTKEFESANSSAVADGDVTREQVAFVRRLLGEETRLGVANAQKALVKALIDVPWEEGLERAELLNRIGRSNQKLSGVLGAFGKRVAGTKGYEDVRDGPSPINAILYSKKGGDWCYRLKPWFRKALDVLYQEGQVQWLRDGKAY